MLIIAKYWRPPVTTNKITITIHKLNNPSNETCAVCSVGAEDIFKCSGEYPLTRWSTSDTIHIKCNPRMIDLHFILMTFISSVRGWSRGRGGGLSQSGGWRWRTAPRSRRGPAGRVCRGPAPAEESGCRQCWCRWWSSPRLWGEG